MRTIKCDKCGKEINRHPLQQVHFPRFTIYVRTSLLSRQIDLCNDCENALYKWLKEENAPTIETCEDAISRKAAIKEMAMDDAEGKFKRIERIEALPSVEPDRPSGVWRKKKDGSHECPFCGYEVENTPFFCENCGAWLKGADDE